MEHDFEVENHGTIVMVRPVSEAAKAWVAENVGLESWQWFGDAFGCEPRMAGALVEGMLDDGLVQG